MIRMSPEDLAALLSATAHDRLQRDLENANSTNSKIIVEKQNEVNKLREALADADARARLLCEQAVFPAVHAERLRFAKGVRHLLSKKAADKLLFQLALGDLR